MQNKPIRVTLVEDDPRFLEGMSFLLESSPSMEVVGRFAQGREAIRGIVEERPEVALIDLGLPDLPGVEVIRAVSEQGCPTELLALTVYDDDEHLFAALRAGAVGYILKDEASLAEVLRAIEEVLRGGAPMSLSIARRILREFRETPHRLRRQGFQGLTRREVEVLDQLAHGFTTQEVAEALHITYQTVRSHQKSIYRKLQVNSLAAAVAAFRRF